MRVCRYIIIKLGRCLYKSYINICKINTIFNLIDNHFYHLSTYFFFFLFFFLFLFPTVRIYNANNFVLFSFGKIVSKFLYKLYTKSYCSKLVFNRQPMYI